LNHGAANGLQLCTQVARRETAELALHVLVVEFLTMTDDGAFEVDDELLAVATRRKFDFCIEHCKLGPGSEILEVGPGWGAFAMHASERGIRVTGVMNSQDSRHYMDKLGTKLGFRWRMILGDILLLKLERRFDAIVLMGVMEHLPNYAATLSQFHKLLEPGGYVYLDASASRRKYAASSFTYRHIYPGNHSFFVLRDFLAALAKTRFHLRGVYDDRVSARHIQPCHVG